MKTINEVNARQHLEETRKDGSLIKQKGKSTMKKGRIFLVDEDELFRSRLRQMLEHQEDIEIVGDCASAEEALSQIEMLSPNIVLMDVWLPGMNGIEACRRFTGTGHDCDVIMLSTCPELINDALRVGAAGYFPKEIKQKELATAIRLTCKWQSLRAEGEANVYLALQTETIAAENLAQFAAKETHDEDEPEWLPPEANDANPKSQDNGSDLVQEVMLVIPPPGDASQLWKFIYQVEETLQASILETTGSWNDTHVMLNLQRSASLADILDELMMMPEVEEAKEVKTPTRRRLFRFSRKSEAVPPKRISVTLGRAVQQLTTAGQANRYLELPVLLPQTAEVVAR